MPGWSWRFRTRKTRAWRHPCRQNDFLAPMGTEINLRNYSAGCPSPPGLVSYLVCQLFPAEFWREKSFWRHGCLQARVFRVRNRRLHPGTLNKKVFFLSWPGHGHCNSRCPACKSPLRFVFGQTLSRRTGSRFHVFHFPASRISRFFVTSLRVFTFFTFFTFFQR